MVASIVSMIFANATASGLAIEPYPIPLASIRSTAPHVNYAVPSIITSPYRSVATLAHASISSASTDKQDLLPLLPTDYLNAGLLDYASYVPSAHYAFLSDFEPITETSSSTINATDVASITIAYITTTVASNELAIESHLTPLASIRSTSSHANQTKPPTVNNHYHSAATFLHVSIASGGAVKQDLLPLPADYLDAGLLDYGAYASDAPYPFHSDSEPNTKTLLPAINTTDVASITVAIAEATAAVAYLHRHPGVTYSASIHRTLARRLTAPIPRSFASRHATAIAISRATPSSADADGPPGGQGRRYSATGPVFRSKSPGPKRARALPPDQTQPAVNQHPDYGQSSPSGRSSEPLNAQSPPSGRGSGPLENAELSDRQKKRNRAKIPKATRAAHIANGTSPLSNERWFAG